jgi:hypothetical protein
LENIQMKEMKTQKTQRWDDNIKMDLKIGWKGIN